jgi:nucleoid-associated protein YgaU
MRSVSPYERFGLYRPEEDATLQEHVFADGDTLSGLAHRFYQDWRLWRLIADRNRITDARKIERGTVLLIPERPLQRGRFEIA